MWRRPFFFVALLLVGGLDLVRSIYTHNQLRAGAVEVLAVPGDAGLALSREQRLYRQHCANCHGEKGQGDGVVAASLKPRPRDFTGGVFKFKSTASADPPTLDDVRSTIRNGLPGTSMPAWADVLGDADVDALAEYVRQLGPHAAWSPNEAVLPVPAGEGSIEQGAKLFVDLGCPACHGKEGRGDGSSAGALKDVWKQPAVARDLTAPWSFRGGSDRAAVYRRLAHGMSGTPMPGYFESANPQDLLDVVAFLGSIARLPPWQDAGTRDIPSPDADPLKRGAYLVASGMCGSCHSVDPAAPLAGGGRIDVGAHGIYFASNLTSDGDSGLGNRRVEEIALALQSGHTRLRRLNFLAMPWVIYGSLQPADALAIAAYLKTVPPQRNFVPSPLHYGFIETVARKLRYNWPAASPARIAYRNDNFGTKEPFATSAATTQQRLLWAQLMFLGLAILSLFRVPAVADDAPHRSSAVLMASLVSSIVIGTAALVVYWYPALNPLPAGPLVQAFSSTVPTVVVDTMPAARADLLLRGRYLYVTSSCAYCHNGNGAGGAKMNSRRLGTVWSANLTAHPSGLGNLADATVLRALTSGVGHDGHSIDPQAMPWPNYSHLTATDQQALLAFLRTLPPVDQAVPSAQPPRSEDCESLTFWIGASSAEAGCR